MPLPSQNQNQNRNPNSCVACARRKVKCDRLTPCSNCSRAKAACVYRAPVPSQRHRKRLTHGDLLSKIQELEALLHSHSIPFDPLSNSWINSPWEDKLAGNPQAQPGSGSAAETAIAAGPHPATQDPDGPGEQSGAAQLWSELPEDLKNPVISQPERPGEDEGEQSTRGGTDATPATPSILIPTHLTTAPEQLELHPDPKHVFKLWQAFADNVNPLTKIIHAPTLQQKILDTAWAAESAPKPLEATMFAVYALAVDSMKPADCIRVLGENKSALASRYRTGALRALSSADLLSTRDLGVLRALALVLMIDPRSELSTTAVALAMRIAHKMGLHRADPDSSMPFFEQEMRVRLWWYIRGLNSYVRRSMGLPSTDDDLGDVRLPSNVNDADLHPSMANPPAVQNLPATEMVYCLMKYDLWKFVRKSSSFSGTPNPREAASQLARSTSADNMLKKRTVLSQVERMLQEKYLDHLDPSIPLHKLSSALAGLTIHRQRFVMFHPRHQPEGGRCMSKDDQDLVFESSVRLLELDRDVRNTNFSTKLVDHMACQTPVEALVYMVSELRQRTSGRLVETAWALLEEIHSHGHPVIPNDDHKFCAALEDLTLEAWETRRQALGPGAEAVPEFIKMLRVARERPEPSDGQAMDAEMLHTAVLGDLIHDETLDWTYWDDFLHV